MCCAFTPRPSQRLSRQRSVLDVFPKMSRDVPFGHSEHLRIDYAGVHAIDVLFPRTAFLCFVITDIDQCVRQLSTALGCERRFRVSSPITTVAARRESFFWSISIHFLAKPNQRLILKLGWKCELTPISFLFGSVDGRTSYKCLETSDALRPTRWIGATYT